MSARTALRSWLSTDRTPPARHLQRSARTRLAADELEVRSVPAGFNYTSFSSDAGLTLARSAAVTNNLLRLTPAADGKAGNAWYTAEKQFVGVAFETTFQFRLEKGGGSGQEGFAFVIQNTDPAFAGSGGSTLAYDGLANSLAVEFDTVGDNDLGGQHIAVHSNGRGRNDTDAAARIGDARSTSPVVLNDGQVHTAKIIYTPGTLSVALDNLSPLNVSVNLADLLGLDEGRAWVGLTAGTTAFGNYQSHDILSWRFQHPTTVDLTTTVSIGDVSQLEGNAGSQTYTFPVYRLGNISGTTSVNWATADRTATVAGGDYVTASGQVVFGPEEKLKTVSVTVNGDLTPEAHETFVVLLTNPVGGTIADGFGLGTISNDEVTVTIDDTTVIEGDTRTAFLGAFVSRQSGGLNGPFDMALAPNGDLLVPSQGRDGINRYGGPAGEFLTEFVSQAGGGLIRPHVVVFGPDGHAYVSSAFSHEVLRYNGTTGAFLGAFVTAGSGGLNNTRGMVFGPDGNLLVASRGSDLILRYQGPSVGPNGELPGQFLNVFASPGAGSQPYELTFGPDGNLYVGLIGPTLGNSIERYNAVTGTRIDTFVPKGGLPQGLGQMAFHDGLLYVTSGGSVLRFQGPSGPSPGAFIDSFFPTGLGGLDNATGLVFGADGNAYVSSSGTDEVLRYGAASQAAVTVRLSHPSANKVTVSYVTANGTALAGSDYEATSGTLTFAPGETVKTILVRTTNDSTGEPTESFVVNLMSATEATLGDSQATVTILDDEGTKFFVVDDSSSDRAYNYGVTGAARGSAALGSGGSPKSGSTSPRGAASDAAGTTRWVSDANGKVYVYTPAGALLGYWASGVNQPEGIATNGTDVWLVDAQTDRVYRFANGAARRDRSQAATGSFPLAAGNTNPKGITTDGASFWVVDDGASADKVFKYTLAGALLGSWTIDPANSSPTGLTLDPTAPQHIWVVDNGTDRVYRYDDAVGLTAGSRTAAASFALAAGNTNPQDIADPPPADQPPLPAVPAPLPVAPVPLVAVAPPPAGSAPVPAGGVGPVAVPSTGRPLPGVDTTQPTARSSGGSSWVRVGGDWVWADDLDRSPVVVDPVRPAPRRLR